MAVNYFTGFYDYWAIQMREGANVDYCNDCSTLYICSRRGKCLDEVVQQAKDEAQVIADRGGFNVAGMERLVEDIEAGPRLSDATLQEISEEVKRRQAVLDEWAAAAPFDIDPLGERTKATVTTTTAPTDTVWVSSVFGWDGAYPPAPLWVESEPGVWTDTRDVTLSFKHEGTLTLNIGNLTLEAVEDDECCGADEEIGETCDDCPNRVAPTKADDVCCEAPCDCGIDDETAEWMNAPMGPYAAELVEQESDPEMVAIIAVAEMLWAQDLTTNEIIARMIGVNLPHIDTISVNVEGSVTSDVDLVARVREAMRGYGRGDVA